MNLNLGSGIFYSQAYPNRGVMGNWPKSISDKGTYSKLEKKNRMKVCEGIEMFAINIT